jgi:hypothetical protein
MNHDPLCPVCVATDGLCDQNCAACQCVLIAKAREDESDRYVGAAKVHWDAGHAWGLHDARQAMRYEERSMMRLGQENFTRGLWIGWAVGALLMVIPLIVLAVTQ